MNEFFNLRRFARLFLKHTREHIRTYLMSVAVLAGVLVLSGAFLFFILQDAPDTGYQTAAYVLLLILSGTIFTSTVFQDFGERGRAIPSMTLPATSFEKFLVGWLYSFPIFLVVYTGIFYLALWGLSMGKHWVEGQHFYLLSLRQPGIPVVFVMYAVLHSIALFGAILFRKLHFIKTGFCFFILLGAVIFTNTLSMRIATGVKVVKMAIPFGYYNFYVGDTYYSINVNNRGPLLDLGTLMLMAVLIWGAAFFKLKEKQV